MKNYQYKKLKTFTEESLPKFLEPSPSNSILEPLKANWLLSAFLIDLTVTNKNFFSGKLLVGLRGQLFDS